MSRNATANQQFKSYMARLEASPLAPVQEHYERLMTLDRTARFQWFCANKLKQDSGVTVVAPRSTRKRNTRTSGIGASPRGREKRVVAVQAIAESEAEPKGVIKRIGAKVRKPKSEVSYAPSSANDGTGRGANDPATNGRLWKLNSLGAFTENGKPITNAQAHKLIEQLLGQ